MRVQSYGIAAQATGGVLWLIGVIIGSDPVIAAGLFTFAAGLASSLLYPANPQSRSVPLANAGAVLGAVSAVADGILALSGESGITAAITTAGIVVGGAMSFFFRTTPGFGR